MIYSRLGETDMVVSQLSFGGSSLAGCSGHFPSQEECTEVVKEVIKSGINYIDTSPWYGHGIGETLLGKALKTVPRESFYIATKVGRYEADVGRMFDFSAQKTAESVELSLQKLNVDCIDLIQVHDLEFAPNLGIVLNETLPVLQQIVEKGKARYIGITGYPLETLKQVVELSRVHIDTVLSYCRCSLHDTALLDYVDYFKQKRIGVINAAVLGMGLHTPANAVPIWHPAPDHIQNACRNANAYCLKNGYDISRLGLHFSLRQQGPQTHLVSCSDVATVVKNVQNMRKQLTADEISCLEHIRDVYFKPLDNPNWEVTEVLKYKRKLAQLQ